jgi:CRISPR/Cas system CMR subunit Cmr6 (Cas7 group RAMP superfamily)
MEKTWEFDTTTGAGSEIVTVVMNMKTMARQPITSPSKRFGLRAKTSLGYSLMSNLKN